MNVSTNILYKLSEQEKKQRKEVANKTTKRDANYNMIQHLNAISRGIRPYHLGKKGSMEYIDIKNNPHKCEKEI